MAEVSDLTRQIARYEVEIASLTVTNTTLSRTLDSSAKIIEHQEKTIADLQKQITTQRREFHNALPQSLQKCINQLTDLRNEAFVILGNSPNLVDEASVNNNNISLQSPLPENPAITSRSTTTRNQNKSLVVNLASIERETQRPSPSIRKTYSRPQAKKSLPKRLRTSTPKLAVNGITDTTDGIADKDKFKNDVKYSQTDEFKSLFDNFESDKVSPNQQKSSPPLKIKLKKHKSNKKKISYKRDESKGLSSAPKKSKLCKPTDLNDDPLLCRPSTSKGIFDDHKRKSANSSKKKRIKNETVSFHSRRISGRSKHGLVDLALSDSDDSDANNTVLQNSKILPVVTPEKSSGARKSVAISNRLSVDQINAQFPKVVLFDFLKQEKISNSSISNLLNGASFAATPPHRPSVNGSAAGSTDGNDAGPPCLEEVLLQDDTTNMDTDAETIIPDIVSSSTGSKPELNAVASNPSQNHNGTVTNQDPFSFESGCAKDDCCDSSFFRLLHEVSSRSSPGMSPHL